MQLIHFDALSKEVLSIGLKIQRIPKSASLLSTVPKLVQKASMVCFRSLNASRYQQCQSKLWYQTDTSGSGSVLAHALSTQTALHTSLLRFPRLSSFVMHSRDSSRRGAAFRERCVLQLKTQGSQNGLTVKMTSNYLFPLAQKCPFSISRVSVLVSGSTTLAL